MLNKPTITSEQRIKWLNKCDTIDRSGVDGGWAFEFTEYTPEVDGSRVLDIRIATRGLTRLEEAVDAVIIGEIVLAHDKDVGEAV